MLGGSNSGPHETVGQRVSGTLTFWGMVGVVMAALKLRDRWDDYQQVPRDAEGGLTGNGRVALHSPIPDTDDEDDNITLRSANLDTSVPGAARPTRKRTKSCCVCCGLNCTFFWKAFGIVLALFTLWNAFKLIRWAVTPAPTGLEGLPAFGSSLACPNAPYIKAPQDSVYSLAVPNGQSDLDISGLAEGTLTLADGGPDATTVNYMVTLRSDDKSLLDRFNITTQETSMDEEVSGTLLKIQTMDAQLSGSHCMHYDVVAYLPRSLKRMSIKASSVVQIRVQDGSNINLDKFLVLLSSMDTNNMITLRESLQATRLSLQATRGWITGEVSLNEAMIVTKTGDAVTNVHIIPAHRDTESAPAHLKTDAGAGRSDIFYESSKAYPHRPINSTHISSRGGDLYLTYKNAEYNGYINLDAKSFTTHNMQGSIPMRGLPNTAKDPAYHGDKEGGDKLTIKSTAGWVGLYF